jgi:hypothetical protein
VLASAGLLGLSAGSAGAQGAIAFAPPTTCPPAAGTVDLEGNTACAIGTSGVAEAGAAVSSFGGSSNNSALATIIGSLGGSAIAVVAGVSDHSDRNVAIAAAAGGIMVTLPVLGTLTLGTVVALAAIDSTDAYRDSAVAVGNGDVFSLAEAGNESFGLDAGNSASASAGYLSTAVAAASNGGLDNFGNAASAIAQLGGTGFANAAGSVSLTAYLLHIPPFGIVTNVFDSTDNTADAAASLGGQAIANAGTGGGEACSFVTPVDACITDQHDNTAQATANLGTATATAGGFKSYEYNNSAQAGVLVGGSATATAGDCATSGCGGSNNTATASASFGGTATADVTGNTTGYAVANSAGTTTTDTETATSSALTSTSPVPGGTGFAYDASGNWVASLNFNGTDKTLSNVGNG